MLLADQGNAISERVRVETPRPATPQAVFDAVIKLVSALADYDRISVGFPGVVVEDTIRTAPNLDGKWKGTALGRMLSVKLGRPAKVLNDAGVQGFGVIEGKGLEMVITLGTGMGCALYIDGRYIPNLELAHHPFRAGKTYEEYVGALALHKVGKRKWNKRVERVLEQAST